MSMSPKRYEYLAYAIREIYAEAELEILRMMTARLNQGMDAPDWQTVKLHQLRNHRKQVEEIIKRIGKVTPDVLQQLLTQVYLEGVQTADDELAELGIALPDDLITAGQMAEEIDGAEAKISGDFGQIHTARIESIAQAAIGTLAQAHLQVLRSTDDVYRRVVAESVTTGITGVENRRDVTQRILNKFADRGVTNFLDRSGRTWAIDSYAEMATRSALGQSSVQGHLNRLSERSYDLVIVSDHPDECPICRPFERQILSISGNDTKYISYRDAKSKGLHHPNCAHTVNAYIEGLTKDVGHGDPSPEGYKEREKQRYMERQIRKWKKREAVALTDAESAKARAKVREWQGNMRDFIDETGRRRLRHREQLRVGKATDTQREIHEKLQAAAPRPLKLDNSQIEKQPEPKATDSIKKAPVTEKESVKVAGEIPTFISPISTPPPATKIKPPRGSLKDREARKREKEEREAHNEAVVSEYVAAVKKEETFFRSHDEARKWFGENMLNDPSRVEGAFDEVDLELLSIAGRAFKTVTDAFPQLKNKLNLVRAKEEAGHLAGADGGGLNFNNFRLESMVRHVANNKTTGYTVPDDVYGVFIHEYGHILDSYLANQNRGEYFNEYQTNWHRQFFGGTGIRKKISEYAKPKYIDDEEVKKRKTEWLSEYGYTSDSEYFAEAFAAQFYDSSKNKPEVKKFKEWLTEVMKLSDSGKNRPLTLEEVQNPKPLKEGHLP